MARWGMVIDLDRCTACQACEVACRVENNVPVAGPEKTEEGRAIFWMKLVPFEQEGYPNARMRYLPRPCMHCEHPPCIKVCPVQATYQDEDGVNGQIYARCIGCRYCMTACPYSVRYFNWSEPEWPDGAEMSLSPDVSLRPKGVVEKCTFCHHRLQAAKEHARAEDRPLKEGEYMPACAESCPTKAITFGDLDNPESDVWKLSKSARAFRLLEELGTEPKVIYLSEDV